jgi:hypothetical protein
MKSVERKEVSAITNVTTVSAHESISKLDTMKAEIPE